MHEYSHTQKAPLCYVVYALGILALGFAYRLKDTPAWFAPLPGALVAVLVGASFHYLRVDDKWEFLRVGFGPIPLFRRKVWYREIRRVEVGRTLWTDGWGIHMSMRGGWVWNIWGRSCVVVHFNKGTLRIGTDDAENLCALLESKITHREDLVSSGNSIG